MKNFIAIILGVLLQCMLWTPVYASSIEYKDIFEGFQEGVEEQSGDIAGDNDEAIVLPTFANENENQQDGAVSIASAIQRFMDFFKLLVAPIAVLVIVIQGLKLVIAGRDSEEVATKAKNFIRYAVEGLILIIVADQIVNVIFGAEGEIFRSGESGAREFGRRTSSFFEGLYSLIQVIIASVAVFVLVTAGMRYVVGSASDDQIAVAKRQITWSLIGLFIIGVSEFVAKDILFPSQGETIGIASAERLFAQVTNFIAGTIGTLSFVSMIYAGYLYVTAAGNEDQVSKAKTIIIGAVIGILLAASAFALTTTIVELDASR